jgi:RNA polymerase sigma-70 factor (ECF subfamily)
VITFTDSVQLFSDNVLGGFGPLQMINEQLTTVDNSVGASSRSGTKAPAEDVALVKRMLAGDEAAFTHVVESHHGSLIRLAMAFVASRDVAEEVVQDTWLAVLSGLHSFEGRSTLKSWIFSILTNRAKTRGVRDKRTVAFSELSNPGSDGDAAVDPDRFTEAGMWSAPPGRWDRDTPEQLLLRQEARAVMERTIAELPTGQRAVVTLRDIDGLDASEVCNILGLSETNQRVLLHRARSKVRAALERYVAGT